MIKLSALPLFLGALTLVAGACGEKKNDQPCKTGSEACQCYGNDTCDEGLSCFAELCLDLSSVAGAASVPGGAGDGPLGEGGDAPGSGGDGAGPHTGGTNSAGSGANAGTGGKISLGGSSSGGSTAGGTSPGGTGAGGSSNTPMFPPDPAGCALVTSCASCCETTGVFALDSLDLDATGDYVTSFEVTSSAATAEFDFASSNEVGAIFFRFSTPQDIGSLSIGGLGTGGTLEIALVRETGKDGCIYPVVGGTLSSTPSTCWGLGAGPYAALPADQIEIRVRSLQAGRAALNVSSVEFGP
jgi:hypothetical protein